MAGVDPYAERERPPAARVEGDPPWVSVIESLGGRVGGASDEAGGDLGGARFVATIVVGDGAHAPVARLEAGAVPRYAVKHGWVAGPPGQPGCVEVDVALVEEVLSAELAGELEWELDPDFGYEVPVPPLGVDGNRALALRPRLLYTAHGRVYEHAELIARLRPER